MPEFLPGAETYAGQHRAWNEVHCLSRAEFDRMAPSVVRLESARISKLAARCEPGSPAHTTLVTARHRLNQFAEALADGGDPTAIAEPLGAAILALTLGAETHPVSSALLNLADRLDYVLAQVRRLY